MSTAAHEILRTARQLPEYRKGYDDTFKATDTEVMMDYCPTTYTTAEE